MIISTNWLSEYVNHGLEVDELSELLTMCGLEVEEVIQIGSALEGVVIGRVLTCEAHPNADRLNICTVDTGDTDPAVIVCGAPNVAVGQNVAVATIGTVLQMPSREDPNEKVPVTIRKSKIRGELSFGMICSAAEVGLGTDHDGILVLDETAPTGEPLATWLSGRGETSLDHAIDIAITPNRPDAICHVGVARDVAAITGTDLILPEISGSEMSPPENQCSERSDSNSAVSDSSPAGFSVEVTAPDACHDYVGILVRDVVVRESPRWLQQRLMAVGLRPRNNIVDITNFVMYEFGQPLHGFDFDRLAGAKIRVHKSAKETKFVTLDSKERTLPAGTLMIADAERDIAIAGIMGGENSEVTDQTTNVLIESAYFDPAQIRRTAKALQLQTDASYRFERGVDPCGQARAAARAADLMVSLAGGKRFNQMVSSRSEAVERTTVMVRRARASELIGVDLSADTVSGLLQAIGFEVLSDSDGDVFECIVPTFRPDIEREVDVIEEVARLYGFDKIPEPIRVAVPDHRVEIPAHRQLRESTRNQLAALGFRETYTNSMLRTETARQFLNPVLPGGRFGGDIVETLNPISQEMAALRPSLLPGVLSIAGYNANHGRKSLRYFEFGSIQIRANTEDSVVDGYTERETLLVVCSGVDAPPTWNQTTRVMDFFDLKGVARALLSAVQLPDVCFEVVEQSEGTLPTNASSALASTEDASSICSSPVLIKSGDEYVGVLATLSPGIQSNFDLSTPLFFMELDWTSLSRIAAPHLRNRYTKFSRFPVVERDLAITVDRSESVGSLLNRIRDRGAPLLREVSLFDLYEGDQIESTMKSIAFSLRFSADRTLVDKEVDECFDGIVEDLEQNSGARLRR